MLNRLLPVNICCVVCNRLHLCITYMHTADGVADRFLSDVEEELAIIMKDPNKPVEGKVSAYLFIVQISYCAESNHFIIWPIIHFAINFRPLFVILFIISSH